MKVQCVLNPGKTLFSFYGACFASFCLLRIFITHFCKSMSTIFALKGVKEGICHCEGNCMQFTIIIIFFFMHYNVKNCRNLLSTTFHKNYVKSSHLCSNRLHGQINYLFSNFFSKTIAFTKYSYDF